MLRYLRYQTPDPASLSRVIGHGRVGCSVLDLRVNLSTTEARDVTGTPHEAVGYPAPAAPTARRPSSPTGFAWPSTSGASADPARGAGARRVRLRPHLRRLRPHAGPGRLAGRGVGPAWPRRLPARRPLLVGGRPAGRRGGGRPGVRDPLPIVGHSKGGITVPRPPCRTGSATWSTSTGCRRAATCPTSGPRAHQAAGRRAGSWLDFRRGPRPVPPAARSTSWRSGGPHEPGCRRSGSATW